LLLPKQVERFTRGFAILHDRVGAAYAPIAEAQRRMVCGERVKGTL
jgi:hypothetical protein